MDQFDSARSHRLPLGGWPGRGPAIVNLAVKGVSNALYIAGCYNQELKAIHIYSLSTLIDVNRS